MATALEKKLIEKIEAEGPLPLSEYMAHCLYDPHHGFYMKEQPFGKEGSFTTAPEITPLFGETLAIWLVKEWEKQGRPTPFTLLEAGPGRGTLMADLLRALKRIQPDAYKAAEIWLLEISPQLRGEQALKLQGHSINWAEALAEIPFHQPTLLIANELLDAFPIEQHLNNTPRHIIEKNNTLAWEVERQTGDIITETSPAQTAWLQTLQKHLTQGAALFIDYGYTESAGDGTGDTLQALHQHKKVDIFHAPGASDLTAHVNFRHVAQTLGGKHLLTDMGPFLLQYGFALRATQALETAPDTTTRTHIETAAQRLISPQEMGALFKVLYWQP